MAVGYGLAEVTSTAAVAFLRAQEGQNEKAAHARSQSGLEGGVLGILDNGQANSSPMFEELARLLKEKLHAAEVIVRKKPTHMQGAPEPMIDELVSRCDAVITGLGA